MKFTFLFAFMFLFATEVIAGGVPQIRFAPQKVISAGVMTGTATVNSTVMDLDQSYGWDCQAVWTGTPNGAIKVQVSDDIALSSASVTNWTDVASSSVSITGAAGNTRWGARPVDYRWLRLTYTNTSSTGVLNATCAVKG